MDTPDQALVATQTCTKCRMGFDDSNRPVYPMLVKRGNFWCCPVCHRSYGSNPHPDLN